MSWRKCFRKEHRMSSVHIIEQFRIFKLSLYYHEYYCYDCEKLIRRWGLEIDPIYEEDVI